MKIQIQKNEIPNIIQSLIKLLTGQRKQEVIGERGYLSSILVEVVDTQEQESKKREIVMHIMHTDKDDTIVMTEKQAKEMLVALATLLGQGSGQIAASDSIRLQLQDELPVKVEGPAQNNSMEKLNTIVDNVKNKTKKIILKSSIDEKSNEIVMQYGAYYIKLAYCKDLNKFKINNVVFDENLLESVCTIIFADDGETLKNAFLYFLVNIGFSDAKVKMWKLPITPLDHILHLEYKDELTVVTTVSNCEKLMLSETYIGDEFKSIMRVVDKVELCSDLIKASNTYRKSISIDVDITNLIDRLRKEYITCLIKPDDTIQVHNDNPTSTIAIQKDKGKAFFNLKYVCFPSYSVINYTRSMCTPIGNVESTIINIKLMLSSSQFRGLLLHAPECVFVYYLDNYVWVTNKTNRKWLSLHIDDYKNLYADMSSTRSLTEKEKARNLSSSQILELCNTLGITS